MPVALSRQSVRWRILAVVGAVAAALLVVSFVAGDDPVEAQSNGFSRDVVNGFSTADGSGFWLTLENGEIDVFGSASEAGDASDLPLNGAIVGGAVTPADDGYWLVALDGGIFSFGGADFHGSMGGRQLNQPVFSMTPTATSDGYWLVARDGGIFSFGDAEFHGSMGGQRLNQPIVGITPSVSGEGYRMVARDGGIFSFGDAEFHGSLPGLGIAVTDVVGMAPTPSGEGYWVVRSGGEVYAFGDAPDLGSYDARRCDPVAGIFSNPKADGFRLVTRSGGTIPFGDAPGNNRKTGEPGECREEPAPAPGPSGGTTPTSTTTPSGGGGGGGNGGGGGGGNRGGGTPPTSFPDADSTGPTGPLAPSGSLSITDDGAVIEDLEITGNIVIDADDVTVRNVKINATTGGKYGIEVRTGNRGILIEDVEIDCGNRATHGIVHGGYTARRVEIYGCEDGFRAGGSTTIEDSWVHDLFLPSAADPHYDAIQSVGGTDITIRGNRLEGPYQGQTSAIIAHAHIGGPLVNLVIEENWLSGGTYTLNVKARDGQPDVENVIIRNNVFERNSYQFGSHTSDRATLVFEGNTFDDGAPYQFHARD